MTAKQMLGKPPFRTGDKVRLSTGKSPIKVLEVDFFHDGPPSWSSRRYNRRPPTGWYIRFAYLSSLDHSEEGRKWRQASDFVHYDPQPKQVKETIVPLYQTKEAKPRFGTLLTKNSKGKMVLEMKGRDGEVEAFDPSEIEEVLPHTVHIRKFNGGNSDAESRHYEMQEGKLAVGDVLVQLSNGTVWEVIELDTKNRSPSQTKNGFLKLEGTRV